MDINLQEQDIFFTSIQLGKCSLNLDNITKDCYNLKERYPSVKRSNHNGYQLDIEIKYFEENNIPGLDEVKNFLTSLADYYNNYFQLTNNRKIVLSNFWININNKTASNAPHTHPGAFLSGVLYIHNSEVSSIKFLNNNISESQHWANYLLEDIKRFPKLSNTFEITPEVNTFIIFTGVQTHYVETNTSDKDRISIAFNFGIVSK